MDKDTAVSHAALSTAEEKIAMAARALQELGAEAARMNGSALADEIDRRTGVGFETAILVVLANGY